MALNHRRPALQRSRSLFQIHRIQADPYLHGLPQSRVTSRTAGLMLRWRTASQGGCPWVNTNHSAGPARFFPVHGATVDRGRGPSPAPVVPMTRTERLAACRAWQKTLMASGVDLSLAHGAQRRTVGAIGTLTSRSTRRWVPNLQPDCPRSTLLSWGAPPMVRGAAGRGGRTLISDGPNRGGLQPRLGRLDLVTVLVSVKRRYPRRRPEPPRRATGAHRSPRRTTSSDARSDKAWISA